MAKPVDLSAEVRDRAGKGAARAVRREGLVPAVVYGDKTEPDLVSLEERVLRMEIDKGKFLATLYTLKHGDKNTRCIPRDVQFHPVTDRPIHVDFLRLGKDARVDIFVPVRFLNEEDSPGLKRGGVLNVVRYEVELNCSADDLPDELEADLTGRKIGDTIHISAIKLPEGTRPTITDRDFTVATIVAPRGVSVSDDEEGEEGGEEGGDA